MAQLRASEKPRYLAYLLRLWQEGDGVPKRWRASLEKPPNGERLGFAGLLELFAFLENETGSDPSGTVSPDEAGSGQPATLE